MGRMFGGKTPLGKQLNKVGSKQEGTHSTQISFRAGTIVSFATETVKDDKRILVRATNPKSDGLYRFIVRLDNGIETPFLDLIGPASKHAANLGHAADLLNMRCLVFFQGPSSKRARIWDVVDDHIDTDTVAGHNQVQIAGAAFAPPGGSLI